MFYFFMIQTIPLVFLLVQSSGYPDPDPGLLGFDCHGETSSVGLRIQGDQGKCLNQTFYHHWQTGQDERNLPSGKKNGKAVCLPRVGICNSKRLSLGNPQLALSRDQGSSSHCVCDLGELRMNWDWPQESGRRKYNFSGITCQMRVYMCPIGKSQ